MISVIQHLMEPEGTLLWSKEPATGLHLGFPVHSVPPYLKCIIICSHLCFGIPNGIFPSGFSNQNCVIQSVSNIFVPANVAGDQTGRRPALVEAVIVSNSPPSRMHGLATCRWAQTSYIPTAAWHKDVWNALYHISPMQVPFLTSLSLLISLSVDVQQWPPCSTNNLLSCVVTCPSQWFFHFGKRDHNHTDLYWVWRMLQYSLSPVAEILDNVSSMSICIVMKDDGVREYVSGSKGFSEFCNYYIAFHVLLNAVLILLQWVCFRFSSFIILTYLRS
jgi:hypothetical protein